MNELVGSFLRHRLERAGFMVRHYPDGSSAAAALARDRLALAIIDVNLRRQRWGVMARAGFRPAGVP